MRMAQAGIVTLEDAMRPPLAFWTTIGTKKDVKLKHALSMTSGFNASPLVGGCQLLPAMTIYNCAKSIHDLRYDTMFYARNDGKRTIVGNAVPSIAPARASGYFSKTECFCFTAQTLAAGEARDMPVRFIVAPDMPENIHTITLSYTFFKNNELTAQLEAPAGSSVGARAAP